MVKTIALFKESDDIQSFDNHFFERLVPLVKKLPGLQNHAISRVTGSPIGEKKIHLLLEIMFENQDALTRALASNEGVAVSKELLKFAMPLVSLYTVEEIEKID